MVLTHLFAYHFFVRRFLIATTAIQLQRSLLHREFWIQLVLERILPLAIPLLAWQAIYDFTQESELAGWGRQEMMAYYLLVFLIGLVTDVQFHYEMSSMVHMGTLNQWLIRPLSFLETVAGHVAARIIMLLIPGAVALLFCITFVPGFLAALPLASFLTGLLVLPLAIIMFGLLSAAVGMLAFWIMHTDSVFALTMLILEFFGGRLLPLSLLPAWLEWISRFLPLRFAIAGPAEAILHPQSALLLPLLLGQVAWCVVLSALVLLLWRAGIRRYDAVGG